MLHQLMLSDRVEHQYKDALHSHHLGDYLVKHICLVRYADDCCKSAGAGGSALSMLHVYLNVLPSQFRSCVSVIISYAGASASWGGFGTLARGGCHDHRVWVLLSQQP